MIWTAALAIGYWWPELSRAAKEEERMIRVFSFDPEETTVRDIDLMVTFLGFRPIVIEDGRVRLATREEAGE